ncbi:MAG: hypothetical protein HOV77_14795 [Hamadaea sp.]|uniref:hypothetical protein n=1 Tax=Hamadaea sp. TaxID=2024425 RepID=UPI0017D6DB62|nr:hypothetical protein [Hamadaea sp.]NUT20450.1 hypothetical protein [Hamadaea sp.]
MNHRRQAMRRVGVALVASAMLANVTAMTISGTPAAAARSGAPQQLEAVQPVTVPLITGDSVRLRTAGKLTAAGARVTATAEPRPGGPAIKITATGSAGGVQRISALPADVARLGAAVDPGLFDVTWLAAHGYTAKDARLPVIVQYASTADPNTRFPGATITKTTADHTAELALDLGQAASFWSALAPGGRLGSGIARIWLKDHILGYATSPAYSATYPVTVTVHLAADKDHQVFACDGMRTTMCVMGVTLLGVTGPAAGQSFTANLLGCADVDPCTTYGLQANVPSGTYAVSGWVSFYDDALDQNVWLEKPEVIVAGATDVSFDVAQARQISVQTPRPTGTYNAMLQDTRTLPDGRYAASLMFSSYGNHQYWVTPTDRVSTGQFRLELGWVGGAIPVTMAIAGKGGQALHPIYPTFASFPGYPMYRLAGRGTAGVVAAGEGTEADFAKVDARGKLVLLTVANSTGLQCYGGSLGAVMDWQLQNAIRAGAVGVLMDPQTPSATPGEFCSLPLRGDWILGVDPTPPMPFVSVTPSDAAALRARLAKGSVSIAYADAGTATEIYDLKFYEQGEISADQRLTVRSADLTPTRAVYRTDTGDDVLDSRNTSAFQPGEYLTGGVTEPLAAPTTRIEYTGPISPELVHQDDLQSPGLFQTSLRVYADTSRRTQEWAARPLVPGSPAAVPDVLAAQPDSWGTTLNPVQLCSYCRQGNTFYPIGYLESDRSLSSGLYGYDAASAHLYRDGVEMPQSSVAGLVAYALPAENSAYRLTTDYRLPSYGEVHTQWDFTSAAPTENRPGTGAICIGTLVLESTDPCAADPLVFIAYRLGDAPARGFTVEAYHEDSQAPQITGVQVWTSTDDGTHWTPATVHTTRDGYAVTPQVTGTGALSVRVVAVDAAGNRVEQTILQATLA